MAQCLCCAIEGRFVIAAPANHRDHFTIWSHCDKRNLSLAERRTANHPAGDFLKPGVKRRGDAFIAIAFFDQRAGTRHCPIGKIGAGGKVRTNADVNTRRRRRARFGLTYRAGRDHRGNHHLRAFACGLQIARWGKAGRRLH